MHPLLENIFSTKTFPTSDNEVIKIFAETSREECELIQQIITENNFKQSIEIGLAFGISALAIAEKIVANGGTHVVIDKYQSSDWRNAGLDLLSAAGLDNQIEFYEDFSYAVLPEFLKQERQFDFAYIDSTKKMDWLLVDFFFLDKMMKIGGVIAFDDVTYPGIRKLMRYISQWPNYEVYKVYPGNANIKGKQKLLSVLKYLPKAKSYIKSSIVNSDHQLGINAHFVALRKVSDDTRDWDWHMEF